MAASRIQDIINYYIIPSINHPQWPPSRIQDIIILSHVIVLVLTSTSSEDPQVSLESWVWLHRHLHQQHYDHYGHYYHYHHHYHHYHYIIIIDVQVKIPRAVWRAGFDSPWRFPGEDINVRRDIKIFSNKLSRYSKISLYLFEVYQRGKISMWYQDIFQWNIIIFP